MIQLGGRYCNILIDFSIPMKLVRLINMCLNETYSRFRVGKHLPEIFPIKNYLKHEEVLLPLLFNIALVYAITRGADKSLARPGRKQATATKLGISSTYSPRSTIHFLARCSEFANHSKKFRRLSVQQGLRSSNDFRVGRKMTTFQLFFQSREQVVVRRGHFRRIGWVIKTLEAHVG